LLNPVFSPSEETVIYVFAEKQSYGVKIGGKMKR